MNQTRKLFLGLALTTGILAAQTTPTLSGVVNPASNIPPGAPNYAIAQGSIFVIYGSNLGPATLTQASFGTALPTTLAGTSVQITTSSTAGAQSLPAYILYASAGQVAGVVPSSLQAGSGNLTVTYNGASGSTQITVAASAFGISTAGSGSGPAAVTFGDYTYVSAGKSAKPGDTLILWGTGIGPLPAGASDALAPPAGNIGTPPQVLVGGVPSVVQYWGRSPGAFVGLDQINFVVPQGVTPGCNVSIVVQKGNLVSNAPTMAVAPNGGPCSDATQVVTPAILSRTTPTKVLAVQLRQDSSYSNGNAAQFATQASVGIDLLQFTPAQLAAQVSTLNPITSFGSCTTVIQNSNSGGGGAPSATPLNAGSSLTLAAPGKTLTLASQGNGQYGSPASLTGIASGAYTLTGNGGSDVGPFSLNFNVLQPVTWTNQLTPASPAVDRTQGLTLNWTGGDATGYVEIVGQGQFASPQKVSYSVSFDCQAPAAAGTFTIPSATLASMPVGTNGFASITLNTSALPYSIPTATGLDATLNLTQFSYSTPVVYK